MQIHISSHDGVPIYIQIVNQVKHLVASGRLSPGEEIPPIRVLAEKLVVNPNTVARAYLELERAGVDLVFIDCPAFVGCSASVDHCRRLGRRRQAYRGRLIYT